MEVHHYDDVEHLLKTNKRIISYINVLGNIYKLMLYFYKLSSISNYTEKE